MNLGLDFKYISGLSMRFGKRLLGQGDGGGGKRMFLILKDMKK